MDFYAFLNYAEHPSDALSAAGAWLTDEAQSAYDAAKAKVTDAVNYVEKEAADSGAGSVVGDVVGDIYDELKAGPPGGPGRSTPEERDAYEQGVRNLPAAAKKKVGDTLTLLEWLTKPWVLAVIGGTVVLAIAAPYVTPFLKRS